MSTTPRSITIINEQILSDDWYSLKKYTVDYQRIDGSQQTFSREVYNKGDGVTVFLYNRAQQSIILTRQFRLPLKIQGDSGVLIETAAGLLEGEDPITRIRAEIEEETGYRIQQVSKIFDAWMSPGAVTEKLHFFIAEYTPHDRINSGGGIFEEGEDIEVLELSFEQAVTMMQQGEINDAKTIMLLQYAIINKVLDAETQAS
ncbi:nudix-type nucleoside diphosphatase, YffH/AdpP family [Rosenbergiella nectarea]|uniref:GDP-mannose pyrophosphatase n=1 Tax=Rosenbergiella nectarea TaxID=988801 RepID=A0A1H9KG08_9GAMM|nr:NUDIX domain-containing protein [Rosenbergiella nectarea]SEQ98086.1 nudix-type nucleoside diphosphatase, YffH/AdpP family [Rosenbergiella nectarea]